MEQQETPSKKRRIMATLKGLAFTLMVLAALWFALRHVLTPLVLPKEATPVPTQTSAFEERIKALEDKVATLENKQAPSTDLNSLEERLKALEDTPKATSGATPADVEALKTDVAKLKNDDHLYVRSLLIISQLQDAIRAGRPFADELTALISLQPGLKETLTPLVPASATGIATLDSLKEQFARTIAPALSPEAQEKTVLGNLRSLVKIRKIGEGQTGKDDQAVIARAEAKLAKGDVAGARQEIDTLSPRARQNFTAWQERAGIYLAAQAAMSSLQNALAEAKE